MPGEIRHAGLEGYLLRSRVKPVDGRTDGAVALVFDANLRVLIHPSFRGDIVFEANVCLLPDNLHQADRLLGEAAELAAARPLTDPDALVLRDPPGQLLLQQRVSSDASADEFEDALAHFLNALTRWRARTGAL